MTHATENTPSIHTAIVTSTTSTQTPTSNPAPSMELDFDSDEPLPVCPMRNNGSDVCESCQ